MHILITGASRGIGQKITETFLKQGSHQIIALSRQVAPLESWAQKYPNFRALSYDLSAHIPGKELTTLVQEAFASRIDILVHNAGLLIKKPIEQFSCHDFDQLFHTNVRGGFLLIRELLPYFASPSHIVQIGSMGGYQGSVKFPGMSLYAASKGALAIMGECLAQELQPRGIAVNTLAIGAVDTQMFQQAFPGTQAPTNPQTMAAYICDFALNGHKVYNGKTLPVSLSTP